MGVSLGHVRRPVSQEYSGFVKRYVSALANTCLKSWICKSFNPALRQAVLKERLKSVNFTPFRLNTYELSLDFSLSPLKRLQGAGNRDTPVAMPD